MNMELPPVTQVTVISMPDDFFLLLFHEKTFQQLCISFIMPPSLLLTQADWA